MKKEKFEKIIFFIVFASMLIICSWLIVLLFRDYPTWKDLFNNAAGLIQKDPEEKVYEFINLCAIGFTIAIIIEMIQKYDTKNRRT